MTASIRTLLSDPSQVERIIQKVIDYQHSDPEKIASEMKEYIVTRHIENSIDRFLDWVDASVGQGGGGEIGVWVSGFYGSGKSSFTKYLGYALDSQNSGFEGRSFTDRLAEQIESVTVRQHLKTLVKRLRPAVVMLDLATHNYGSNIADVSEILYRYVLGWAGYSDIDLQIADFEMTVDRDGRREELLERSREYGKDWLKVHNRSVIARNLASKLNAEMYGEPLDFSNKSGVLSIEERVKRIIEIVRHKTHCEYIFFILDEVGQHIGAHLSAIEDMQGLVQNMRTVGEGKVFLMATAQQTLTESDSRAAFNSPYLFKLKGRFPLSITLESSDIEEICWRRLLRKSASGEEELTQLFKRVGSGLKVKTKLANAKLFEGSLNESNFASLYPFLPSHFKILLSVLGTLSKGEGGTGLRSAIKVVQDVLTGGRIGHIDKNALINMPIGKLVTAENFYNELRQDIEAVERDLSEAAQKTAEAYRDDPLALRIAKTLVITELLKGFEATPANLSALLIDNVSAPDRAKEISTKLDQMARDSTVPIGRNANGTYHYLNERMAALEHEKLTLNVFSSELTKERNTILAEIFGSFLRISTGKLSCSASLFLYGNPTCISGVGKEPLELQVAFYETGEDPSARKQELLEESLETKNAAFLLTETPEGFTDLLNEIIKSDKVADAHAGSADQVERDFVRDQKSKASQARKNLQEMLNQSFDRSSLFIRGAERTVRATEDFGQMLESALSDFAGRIFDKHNQVENADPKPGMAKHILQLKHGMSGYDPLELLEWKDETPVLQEKPAAASVLDYLKLSENLRGGELLDHFMNPPFGWIKDITLYVVSALFVTGHIELNIAGHHYRTVERAVLEAFSSPQAFKAVGVAVRDTIDRSVLLACGQFLANYGVAGIVYTEQGIAEKLREFAIEKSNLCRELARDTREAGTYGTRELELAVQTLESWRDEGIAALWHSIGENQEEKARITDRLSLMQILLVKKRNGFFEDIAAGARAAELSSSSEIKQRWEVLKKELLQPSFTEKGQDLRGFISEANEAGAKDLQEKQQAFSKARSCFEEKKNSVIDLYDLTVDEIEQLPKCVSVEPGASAAQLSDAISKTYETISTLEDKASELALRRNALIQLDIPESISTLEEIDELIQKLNELKTEVKHGRKCILKAGK
ncbi:MAG: hypothetical protein ACFWTZ_07220 [Burkholderia sp.]|jgi:hypothetical protein